MAERPVSWQADEVLPPRKGKQIVIVVDGTSRAYDLWTIAFGTPAINTAAGSMEGYGNARVFVTMTADGGDVNFLFGETSPTVDETAAVAAGAGLAFTANACEVIPAGKTEDFYIHRLRDRYLALKTTGLGTVRLRLRVSSTRGDSQPTSGV